MKGFFKKEDTEAEVKRANVRGCGACKLYKKCNSPKMKPSGEGKKKILIVAEAPGKKEDNEGVQLIGQAGRKLQKMLRSLGCDLHEDCWKTNAVNCRPPKNRTPSDAEISYCRPAVLKAMKKKPSLVLLLGTSAVKSYLGHRWKKDLDGIAKWRGWTIPDREYGCWVCPTYHPSFLLYEKTPPSAEVLMMQDLKRALGKLKEDVPVFKDEREMVEILHPGRAVKFLNWLERNPRPTAFDYETTGLKPHREGHRIVCASIAWARDKAVAFSLEDERVRKAFVRYLKNAKIFKIASNIKFEEVWSRVILGTKVRGWKWCTMNAAHVLDNRRGITSVKFQAAVRYGLLDYDSEISPFLKATPEEEEKYGANGFNTIDQADPEKLLLYCGIDSLLEFRVCMDQKREI
jgi:DNA polymerase